MEHPVCNSFDISMPAHFFFHSSNSTVISNPDNVLYHILKEVGALKPLRFASQSEGRTLSAVITSLADIDEV